MASVGLKGFWVGNYAEATKGTITWSGGKKVAKAVQFTENRTVSDVSIYADNGKDDSAYAVTDVALGITPNGFSLNELTDLIGCETKTLSLGGESAEVVTKSFADESVRKGIGMIAEERISGTSKFIAYVYPNVAFRPSDSNEKNTKGESISFATDTYSGKAYADLNGKYLYQKEFNTEALAETWLNTIFGVTAPGIVLAVHDAEVAEGADLTLSAYAPSGETISWQSDDTNKATVSSGGVVHGVDEGTVTITASVTTGGHTYTDTCTVRVTAAQ